MYILYAVSYPEARFPSNEVRGKWTAVGLPSAAAPSTANDLGPREVSQLIESALRSAGAASTPDRNGDLEVPRSAGTLLEQLDRFYESLYPERKSSSRRDHFQYEELEWLGEF